MKNFREFFVVAALVFVASTVVVEAKGLGGPIRGMLMFRDVAVVVRAHVSADGGPAIVVDQSYYGPFKAGERVAVEEDAFEHELTVSGGGSQPEMFLILEKAESSNEKYFYGRFLFAKGLVIDDYLSRRLSDGNVYFWSGNTKTATYTFWRFFTNTASLTRDETHADLAALEADLADGLARHDEWARAKAATDPAVRLTLLRPFLLPGGSHHFTPYDVWSCTQDVLEQAESAGPASVPFFEGLLKEPSFQDDYAPEGWLGIGAQERAAVMKSLALVEAEAATDPQEKLAKLRAVFDLPQYEFRAGYPPSGMVDVYLDRGLAAVTSVDATEARPFLQGLLALPQFQDGFEPVGQTSEGHEMRVKIQAAVAGLR